MATSATADQSQTADLPGFVGRIPVRNLWLWTPYASDLFRTGGVDKVGLEDNPDHLPIRRRKYCRTLWKCVNVVISALDTDRAMPIQPGLCELTCSPQSGTNCFHGVSLLAGSMNSQ